MLFKYQKMLVDGFAAKMVVPFFGPFLHLRPLFPIENVRILEIVLLHMIKAVSIYILEQRPPPLGNCEGWTKPQVWGTIGSGLTPRVQKCPQDVRFPALISVGGADRFLEDLSPDMPRN